MVSTPQSVDRGKRKWDDGAIVNEKQTESGLSSDEQKRIQTTVGDALRGNDPIPPPDMLVEMFGPPENFLEAGATAAKGLLEIKPESSKQPSWITRAAESLRGLGDRLAEDTGSLRITKRGAAVLLAAGLATGALVTNELSAKTYTTPIYVEQGEGTDAAVDQGLTAIASENDIDISTNGLAGRVEDAKHQAYNIIGQDGTYAGETAELVVTDRMLPLTDSVSVQPIEAVNDGKQKSEVGSEKYPPALPLDTDPTTIEPPNTH